MTTSTATRYSYSLRGYLFIGDGEDRTHQGFDYAPQGWESVRSVAAATLARADVEGWVPDPNMRAQTSAPLPTNPPTGRNQHGHPLGWHHVSYHLTPQGERVSLSLSLYPCEPVSLAKRYLHGTGGLFDYAGRGSAWPYLPARGTVDVFLPGVPDPIILPDGWRGEGSQGVAFSVPGDPCVIEYWTPEQCAEAATPDEDGDTLGCEWHDEPGIGTSRGPYDAGGGCDSETICALCLRETTVATMDVRTARHLWQIWGGPGE